MKTRATLLFWPFAFKYKYFNTEKVILSQNYSKDERPYMYSIQYIVFSLYLTEIKSFYSVLF